MARKRAGGADGSFLNIRIPAGLKARVSEAARRVDLTVSDYVLHLLDATMAEPYSPWMQRPGPRKLLVGKDIFTQDTLFFHDLKEAAASGRAGDFTIRTTVPRAFWIGGARLETYRNYLAQIERDLRDALEEPRISLRRLYIDRNADEPKGATWPPSPEAIDLWKGDAKLLRSLGGGKPRKQGRPSKAPEAGSPRVEFRCATVRDLMGAPGLQPDRESLNDFNVYGDLAVSFTTETSHGLLYRCIASTMEEDVRFWTRRFDDLWSLARPLPE